MWRARTIFCSNDNFFHHFRLDEIQRRIDEQKAREKAIEDEKNRIQAEEDEKIRKNGIF